MQAKGLHHVSGVQLIAPAARTVEPGPTRRTADDAAIDIVGNSARAPHPTRY